MQAEAQLTVACMPCQVRRQFLERPGILTYAEKPDYARCVSIVATSALKVGSWGSAFNRLTDIQLHRK